MFGRLLKRFRGTGLTSSSPHMPIPLSLDQQAVLLRDLLILHDVVSIVPESAVGFWVTAKYAHQKSAADRLGPWSHNPVVLACLVQRCIWNDEGEGVLERVEHVLLKEQPELGLALLMSKCLWPWPSERCSIAKRIASLLEEADMNLPAGARMLLRLRLQALLKDRDPDVRSDAQEYLDGLPDFNDDSPVDEELMVKVARASIHLADACCLPQERRLKAIEEVRNLLPGLEGVTLVLAYSGVMTAELGGAEAESLIEQAKQNSCPVELSDSTVTVTAFPEGFEPTGRRLQKLAPGVLELLDAFKQLDNVSFTSLDGPVLSLAKSLIAENEGIRLACSNLRLAGVRAE